MQKEYISETENRIYKLDIIFKCLDIVMYTKKNLKWLFWVFRNGQLLLNGTIKTSLTRCMLN